MNVGQVGFFGRLGGLLRSAQSLVYTATDTFSGAAMALTAHVADTGETWIARLSSSTMTLDGAGKLSIVGASGGSEAVMSTLSGVVDKIRLQTNTYYGVALFWVGTAGNNSLVQVNPDGSLNLYERISGTYYLRATSAGSTLNSVVGADISGQTVTAVQYDNTETTLLNSTAPFVSSLTPNSVVGVRGGTITSDFFYARTA